MDTTIKQQLAMDEALVPTAQRLKIGRSNFRLLSEIKSKESTLQLVYDVLRICLFFKAFLVTADVPEIYMQEFWAIDTVHSHAIRFKTDKKKHIVDLELFRNILHICPRFHGQSFAKTPFEEEILAFIRFLGHSAAIRTLSDVNINKLYQPWRSFVAIINKYLTKKSSGYDSLRLSQAQILLGLYHKRNVDYDCLICEDFVYQVEHKNQKKSNEMNYPRFTKAIIHHFMSKNPSIPRRNKVNWHYVRDGHMFSTIKLAYKEYYAIATGEAVPNPKASVRRTRRSSDTSITPPTDAASPRLTASAKGKKTTKASKAKILSALSEPSGSGADAGTGSKPGVPDVPTDESEEELSWNSTDDEGDEDEKQDDDEVVRDDDEEEGGGDDQESDDEYAEEIRDDESFDPIPQTPKNSEDEGDGEEDQGLNIGEEERHDEEEEEEKDELYRDVNINQGRGLPTSLEFEDSHVTLTPVKPDGQRESSSVSSQFVTSMLNPKLDVGMESIFGTTSQIDVQTPTYVAPLPITAPNMTSSTIATTTTTTTTSQAPILPTIIPSDIIQNLPSFGSLFRFDDRLRSLEENSSEVMQKNQFAGAVSAIPKIVQHYMDQRMNEAVKVAAQIQSDRLREEAQRENDEFLRTVDENIKKNIKEKVKEQVKAQVSKILPRIEQAVNEQLEAKVLTQSSHSSRTSYAVGADLSETELKKILIEKMEGNKRRDNDADKDEEPSAGPDRGSKRCREGKEPESASAPTKTATRRAGRSTQGSKSRQASVSEFALAEEPMQTTSQMEEPSHSKFDIDADDQLIVPSSQHPEWFSQQQKPPTLDRAWNMTLPAVHGSIQPWISELVKQADTRSSFNKLMDTPLDFSNFLMNQLRVDTLTPELLAGPTYELMNGSCKSLIELEYHLEEVYKATTDQLDWVNPEGQQYPHNLLHPLSLIPDNRGRRVIPFEHFINNDLEYLHGGASSRKYTTSVTKTKAADYGYIKWIEDLVPRTMWIQEPIDYDKHALWGVSHWGRKRQQFYGFTVNRESARDLYSKRRIIVVTKLKIVEWHSYKHLDWITVRRDDDKLYKFKEGDFKRLRIQDIEDMLMLLVQGKLTNLTVEERFAFNVSLQMFTRSIVIQRRVEDLQLGVESYQKRLNLTKLDTLMQIDELHKFSDGTLTDVRTALDDRLKGIQIRYLPQTIWKKSDKDRAAAMIQAIDKRMKTRRIMRSLERFV
nr:hypothetical protein [Tanacetum cinerariifolium]